MNEAETDAKNAAEKAALEAAFAEAMKGATPQTAPLSLGMNQALGSQAQAAQANLPPDRRGRVFSFTGASNNSSSFSPQVSQGEEGESPAFGRTRVGGRSFSRGNSGGSGGLEERLQNMEELLARSNEYHISQMRKQQELEVKISERCGFMMQEVLESMIPHVVERLLERLAQCLDFSELRDQLIDSFSASTDMLPVVEERSEVVLALLQEDRVVKNRMSTDFTRIASSIDTLVAHSSWQVPLMERLEAMQRAVESMSIVVQRSTSLNGTADATLNGSCGSTMPRPEDMMRKNPLGQGRDKQRTSSGEGLQGLQAALQRAEQQRSRPPSGHSDRAPPPAPMRPTRTAVNGRGNDPSWYTSMSRPAAETGTTNGRAPRAPSSTSPSSDSPVNKPAPALAPRGSFARAPSPGKDWPWQPKPPLVDEEVHPEPATAVPPLPTQPPRSRPSDFFSARKSEADTRG